MSKPIARRTLLTAAAATGLAASLDADVFAQRRQAAKPGKHRSFRPGREWLDTDGVHINAHGGGMLYERGTYYWFGEHKTEGIGGNVARVGVRCYSSKDLYNWKNEGVALSVVKDDPTHPIAEGSIIERPKVIYNPKTRQYVMWFHLELKGQGYSAAQSGVAVSPRVTGPYKFVANFRPNNQMARDQTLFVDTDGKAYQFYASEENHTMHVSLLSDDFTKPAGRYERIFVEQDMEAPCVFKHQGRYWFIGSGLSGWAPNAARAAVADSIWGEWKRLPLPCEGSNTIGAHVTFYSQGTFALPVVGKPGAFIFMADNWTPHNAIDGRYTWLPINIEDDRIVLRYFDEWDLSRFDERDASRRSSPRT